MLALVSPASPDYIGDPMDPHRLSRLRFRAWRRGFREADLILGPFADAYAASLTEDELESFEMLLEQSDHDIYAWILGSAPIPPAFDHQIMTRLRAFAPPTGSGS
jgi:antitoxin CptB